jgi:hypothetical protein
MKALREEVLKAIKIDIWKPINPNTLMEEQLKLILPQMLDYLEKYKTDNTFDTFKVKVLARGDKQWNIGESDSPAVCVESLLMLLSFVIHQDLEILKVNVGSAFMGMPITDDVKHKCVKLDKQVAEILCEVEPEKYKPYLLSDAATIVKMKMISYSDVEAAHYWWKGLTET